MPGKTDFTAARVIAWAQLKGPEPAEAIGQLIPVVTDLIDQLPDAPRTEDGDWAPATVQAAIMMTARLYRRRNSPGGVEAFAEGGATYVARFDPDIEQMLRTGKHARPRAR